MCGITGFIHKKAGFSSNKNAVVKEMTTALTHRGPDDEAYYDNDICTLGMRRLSILDLTPGIYPFISEDCSIALVYNGEIYNYPQLKKELESYGYKFKTTCDGEAILHGYDKWGVNVFAHLRGMFALAIRDNTKNVLVIARDRVGIKPLYFINDTNFFAFASEAKALYTLKNSIGLDLHLDYDQISNLLGFMFLPESTKTIVGNIHKLEPGSYGVISNDNFEIKRYWNLSVNETYRDMSYKDALVAVEEKLIESVSMHMLSDVPLGLMLSGGVDSSLVAAIMTKKLGISTHTFTAAFNHKFNESALAAETAKFLGTNHTEINIDVSYINNHMETLVGIFDDLTTFDGGILTTSLLCSHIKAQGIKVLLLGEGADEVFGGYSWFGLSKPPFNIAPKIIRDSIYYYAISRNLGINFGKYKSYLGSKVPNTGSTFNDISKFEITTQLPNHLLMKVDKGSMSHSIEARVPYLDHELIEMVYSLPTNFKIAGNFYNPKKPNEKMILRDIASKYLPNATAFRKKKGFMLPMNDVLQANVDNVRSLILAENSISRQLFAQNELEDLFEESSISLLNMQREYFKWRLYILESWAKFYNIR